MDVERDNGESGGLLGGSGRRGKGDRRRELKGGTVGSILSSKFFLFNDTANTEIYTG